jgi:hypothetical protein
MTRRAIDEYDFVKGLFDEKLLKDIKGYPRRQTTPRRRKIESVTVHHMIVKSTNNGGACQACIDIWRTRPASAHYGVDKLVVTQFVYDNSEAWGNADSYGNQTSIIVEHANKTLAPTYEIDEETLETSAKLVAGLHIIHDLGRPWSKNAFSSKATGTVLTHRSWYATACPGPYFEKHWDRYMRMVQSAYDHMVSSSVTPAPPVIPAPSPTPTTPGVSMTHIKGVHWNIADDDTTNGYKAENKTRGDEVGRHIRDMDVDVFLACEAGDKSLISDVSRILPNGWTKDDKSIWIKDKSTLLVPRKTYNASPVFRFLKRGKYGAAMFGVKNNKKYGLLEIHTDFRAGANQSGQVLTIFEQFLADSVELHVPKKNLIVAGDFNWDGTSADNPFRALSKYKFEEKGDDDTATFLDGRHLDGILGHKDAEVLVTKRPRANKDGIKLSDHNPLEFRLTLS